MTYITIEKQVVEMALEHIEYVANIGTSMSRDTCHYLMDESRKEAAALRAALEGAKEVEPVATVGLQHKTWMGCDGQWIPPGEPHKAVHLLKDLPVGTALYTNPAPAVPEGWQLVPKEPTLEMLDRTGYGGMSNYEIYKAMLQAAPKP